MDREKLRADLEFSSVGMQPERHAQKLTEVASEILAAIAREKREPDPWEKYRLGSAVGAIGMMFLGLAHSHLRCALTAPEDRSNLDIDYDVDELTADVLAKAIEDLDGPPMGEMG